MILSKWVAQAGLVICMSLAFTSAALAQASGQGEAVFIKRAAQLREAPGETSRTLVTLPLQAAVTRLGDRQGPWIKVRMADGTLGWVHMFDITAAASTQTGNVGTGALRSITSFFNKGSAPSNASSLPTSTVGIRGLGAEDLANAQPNPAAVAQIESTRLDATQARQFASLAALSSRTVSPLPVPSSPARAGAPRNSGGNAGSAGSSNDSSQNGN